MATAVKFHSFVEALAEKVHNLASDTLKVALLLDQPDSANDAGLGDTTGQLGTGNGYTSGGNAATQSSSSQTTGTYKLVVGDVTFTASGGSIGPFRYSVLYNDTPTTPVADPLILYWDYGSNLTLSAGNSFSVDFDATNGVLTIA